jgi:hypothetical protein
MELRTQFSVINLKEDGQIAVVSESGQKNKVKKYK